MTASAFRASYADWKLIRTRQTVQIVFEIPLSDADTAYNVLGGMPDSARERWVGIAPLDPAAPADDRRSMAPTQRAEAETKGGANRVSHNVGTQPATPRPAPDKPRAGAKRDWRDLEPAQQAGIRCAEPVFQAFLKEQHQADWHESRGDAAECVRLICSVSSRSEFATNQKARIIWHQLDGRYQAWKTMEHA